MAEEKKSPEGEDQFGAIDRFADMIGSIAIAVILAVGAVIGIFNSRAANVVFEAAIGLFETVAISVKRSGGSWVRGAWRAIPFPTRKWIMWRLGVTIVLLSIAVGSIIFLAGTEEGRSLAAWMLIAVAFLFFWLVVIVQSLSHRLMGNDKLGEALFNRPLSIIALILSFSAVLVVALPETLRSFSLITLVVATLVTASSFNGILGQRSNRAYKWMVRVAVFLMIYSIVVQGVLPGVAPFAYAWVEAQEARVNSALGKQTSVTQAAVYEEYVVLEEARMFDENGKQTSEILKKDDEVLIDHSRSKKFNPYPYPYLWFQKIAGGKVVVEGYYPSDMLAVKRATQVVTVNSPEPSAPLPAAEPTPAVEPLVSTPRVLEATVTAGVDWAVSDPPLVPVAGDLVIWGPFERREDVQKLQSIVGWQESEALTPAVFGGGDSYVGKSGVTKNKQSEPLRFRLVDGGTEISFKVRLEPKAFNQ